ncbi:pentatricopeptide repeat-containing protein At1g12775, mitochondrial-like [Durio zibethinus]|uniref:Pentatricopeptide repeat-containing protein At1g12775, mitochondrial-like n=1 Tax=Durio zibethinus TaxID=66656 RepID=A0A6P6ACN4_DURZI|nr:pentatricopeptide repeat-containing protein At1g12775, mitochondrial-like [Durio zibethinus]XP_022762571.1 pentatricopeptide repeat-containing protein At1g12775, mitochondrial-like [Durio zibethinus]
MKTLKLRQFEFLFLISTASKPQPSKQHIFSSSFSAIPNLSDTYLNTKPKKFPTLTLEEVCKINLLIPRLCLSNHLTTAVHLTTMALLTISPPNPKSLSLSILIHSLTLRPDMKLSMSLLTRLTRIPQPHPYPHLTPISTMLIASYLKRDRPKDAFKVYSWMLRPGFPCNCMVDKTAYGILVGGLCASGSLLEGLRVLRDMLRVHLLPGEGLRKKVVRSLLREARVKEAKAFEELLPCIGFVGGLNKVLDLLDHTISEIGHTS